MPDRANLLEPTPPATATATIARAAGTSAAGPVKVCLLILFNHRYDGNLPKLDWIYRPRYEHVRYLVPFYRGDRPDVIPVYYSSFQFQGYFREAWQRLRGEGFTHFVICADDMILNPRLTGENILRELKMDPEMGYIRQLQSLGNERLAWSGMPSALVAVEGKNGVNWERELPSFESARANLAAKGYPMFRLGWHNLREGIRAKGFFQTLFYLTLRLQRRRVPATDLLGLPYPLLNGNSDLLIIPADHMEKFTTYCAVFAAMGVFVEVAAPTALVLSCPRVVCLEHTGWQIRDDWGGRDDVWEAFCKGFDYRLDRFLAEFEPRTMCIHPIKLSQWSIPAA